MRAARDVTSPALPTCKHCTETMTLIGKLPSVAQHPAVRVFRCHGCNRIASEEI
jgi:hypothetical protein